MNEPRAPDVKEQAKQDYLNGMKYKDLAEKYNVSLNTIKSWIKRYNWSKDKKEKGAPKSKKGAPYNNKNAEGHGAPARNKNAESHGFFSKIFPPETMEVVQDIMIKNPLDMLWENIIIQYTAIARSQRIMDVKSKEEMIKELKKSKVKTKDRSTQKTSTNESEKEFEYEFQFAWDRQATFLKAQSRAMAELRSLIKQHDEMVHNNPDMATEEQRLRMEKLRAEIEKVRNPDDNKPIEIMIKRKSDE